MGPSPNDAHAQMTASRQNAPAPPQMCDPQEMTRQPFGANDTIEAPDFVSNHDDDYEATFYHQLRGATVQHGPMKFRFQLDGYDLPDLDTNDPDNGSIQNLLDSHDFHNHNDKIQPALFDPSLVGDVSTAFSPHSAMDADGIWDGHKGNDGCDPSFNFQQSTSAQGHLGWEGCEVQGDATSQLFPVAWEEMNEVQYEDKQGEEFWAGAPPGSYAYENNMKPGSAPQTYATAVDPQLHAFNPQGLPPAAQGVPGFFRGPPVVPQNYPVVSQGFPLAAQDFPVVSQAVAALPQGSPFAAQVQPMIAGLPVLAQGVAPPAQAPPPAAQGPIARVQRGRYNDADEHDFQQMLHAGMSDAFMAAKLGRTENAIEIKRLRAQKRCKDPHHAAKKRRGRAAKL